MTEMVIMVIIFIVLLIIFIIIAYYMNSARYSSSSIAAVGFFFFIFFIIIVMFGWFYSKPAVPPTHFHTADRPITYDYSNHTYQPPVIQQDIPAATEQHVYHHNVTDYEDQPQATHYYSPAGAGTAVTGTMVSGGRTTVDPLPTIRRSYIPGERSTKVLTTPSGRSFVADVRRDPAVVTRYEDKLPHEAKVIPMSNPARRLPTSQGVPIIPANYQNPMYYG
jgi:hypothetical protein